jgi:hypothetical protein
MRGRVVGWAARALRVSGTRGRRSMQTSDHAFPGGEPSLSSLEEVDVTDLWFVLPDGTRMASQVPAVPRRGDIVRFAGDGEPYEVAQIEHIATTNGARNGMRYVNIVIRLAAVAVGAS